MVVAAKGLRAKYEKNSWEICLFLNKKNTNKKLLATKAEPQQKQAIKNILGIKSKQ